MDRRFGLHRGSQISSWITLIYLYSTLCIWTRVESWSYFYSDTTMNWNDASEWCQRMNNSHMVAIQNQEEITHLNSWLPKKNGYYWIGIRKINNNWTWVGTNKSLTPEATNWAENEPNNGKKNGKKSSRQRADEDCVEMYIKRDKEEGKWNDESCAKLKTALCFTAACKKDSCQPQHGECVETINNHTCSCFPGFYGDKCEHVVQCDKEEVTVHAKASVSCSHVHGDYAYDSLCQYSCEDGYKLSISGPMKCNASGKWSEQPPTCELVQCKELSVPEKGFMKCSDPLGSSSYQSTCTFSCEEGYFLAGSMSEHLQCQSSGHWNDSQPQCVAVMCPFLEHPENGAVNCGHDDNIEMRFSYENSCRFTCDQGYRLVGANTVTCTSTKEWSENIPHCEAITCQQPEGDAFLLVECSNATNKLPPGATCNFTCGAGFELQGASSIQCSEEGQWTTDIPTCKALQCPYLEAPMGGQISCVAPPSSLTVSAADPHPQGSICTFSCDEGHELQGSLNMECTQTGHWNSTPPTCTVVQCKELSVPEKGFMKCSDPLGSSSYQSTCTFSCEEGYFLAGSMSEHLQCQSSGHWNDSQPQCVAVMCPFLEHPENGAVNCGHDDNIEMRFSYENSCRFTCDQGYRLVGANTVTCTSTKEWSENIPHCEAITCQQPEGDAFLLVECSNATNELPPDTTCNFTCGAGFELQGASSIQCSEEGQWTTDIPTCKALQCPYPEAPVGGQISCVAPPSSLTVSAADPHPQGSICTFSCDEGHELQGSLNMECTQTGHWNSTPPTCTVVTCDLPEHPANSFVSCSDLELIYNTQCNFTCDQGHSLHGQEVITCNRHGNWTAEMPTCQRSGPSVNPTTLGLAAGGAASLSGLSLAAWLLKRLRKTKNTFELNSSEDLLDPPQHYRNSIDSDILI